MIHQMSLPLQSSTSAFFHVRGQLARRLKGKNGRVASAKRHTVSVQATATQEQEKLASYMSALRGQGVNEDDFASSDLKMDFLDSDSINMDDSEGLPKSYDPVAIERYWGKRPLAVAKRVGQILSVSGGFVLSTALDAAMGKLEENDVKRAVALRNIITSLGPAYIKLGQALSIRPDLLSPAAMGEMQQLCDKVPAFPNDIAMKCIEDELGAPPQELFDNLTPDPIAAASLGQVYKGTLRASGETVAIKVQRPFVLETITVDLFVLRRVGLALREVSSINTDVVALLDEWAMRFFDELDYVKEGKNATRFAEEMKDDLPQIVVPKTFSDYTSRRVLTTGWLEGEKLSQSSASDVTELVQVGVLCFLKQLLDTGNFHADPHPGNLIRTTDGRLAILDFGLMTQVDEDIKFGMIEAVAHLIRRDYALIVEDFVTLDFIPENVDLKPILPVLARVFDEALDGDTRAKVINKNLGVEATTFRGKEIGADDAAKQINFQELAADLAQITFDYPFRIPPYFALIIRAIATLEGIALVGQPDFAIVDEAFPYISKRLLTDPSPRSRAALEYLLYEDGDGAVLDVPRVVDVLQAFETYTVYSQRNMGDVAPAALTVASSSQPEPSPLPFQLPDALTSLVPSRPASVSDGGGASSSASSDSSQQVRAALTFMLSPEGTYVREVLLDEVVKGIDALSRDQATYVVAQLGLQNVKLPVFFPGAVNSLALSPNMSSEDKKVAQNTIELFNFLTANVAKSDSSSRLALTPELVAENLPVLSTAAQELLPEIFSRLFSRIAARTTREIFLDSSALPQSA